MARLHSETIPTSTLASTARVVDGFVTTQSDHQGISSSFTRAYTATGITRTATDGRGNTTTTHTDLAGRSISSTDAAGNSTTTVYDAAFDAPSVITNAQGKTSCYKYDQRGRKVAEWGTAIQSPRRLVGGLDKCAAFAPKGRGRNGVRPSQPALFGYDDADNLTALTTFRADSGDITTDPSERTDGDTTTWAYHPAAGVELSKTYADNSQVVKTYDAFNRLATETNARGIVKTLSYDAATGRLTGISFSDDETPSQSFAYNILGRLTQVTDAAGTRTLAYNEYSELQSDSLDSGAHTHLVTELQDSYGRSTGFTYARSGATQFTTSVGYATDGRIATAGFMHGGVNRQFSYGYLSGSNLLHTLTQPNGITLTQSYEEHRDLLTGMQYHRGSTLVVERSYSYDSLGRPTNRSTARQGSVKNDTFTHNDRSEIARRSRLGRLRRQAVRAIGQTRSVCPEGARSREAAPSQLTAATLGTDAYSYSYDNIGNRKTAQEAAEEATAYDANNLNQYTAIQTGEEAAFVPTFDADGNQTKVKTSTGIWNVVYNAENRPVTFTSEDGATVVECTYDYMVRRHTRRVTVNGSVTNYLRYIYRGYLQIAAINAVSGVFQWFILWDPTQPVATRPLGIRKDGTWYTYGWDLTKNICEVFGSDGYIKTAYTYTPYGAVTANGNVTQPIRWSSEYNDTELGLVYYNYRHYNPADGRWTGTDVMLFSCNNLYSYVRNNPYNDLDILGLLSCSPLTAGGLSEPINVPTGADVPTAIKAVTRVIQTISDIVVEEISSLNEQYALSTRAEGIALVLAGTGEVALGIIAIGAPEVTTTAMGAIMTLHGVDVVSAGVKVIYEGKRQSTETHRVITEVALAAGADQETASTIASSVELAIGGKAVFGTKMTNCTKMLHVEMTGVRYTIVSRWGDELTPGKWVMKGEPTLWNYIKSGKYQPGFSNQFAWPWQVNAYRVPCNTLKTPPRIEKILKTPLGQRIYKP